MARINIRLEDALYERMRSAYPTGQMSVWIVGLIELSLDGPKKEDLSQGRVLKRLDELEDFRVFIEGRIAKSEGRVAGGPVPLPGPAEKPFKGLTVTPDAQ
tara:strand:- start:657 stop:959 length:303 start_codon:yes stop_codon:yes gene_type:complete